MVHSWLEPYNKAMTDSLIIAGRQFRSRLIVGTGKYKSFQETARALEASGADMVTVAVRRVNLDRSKESLLDYIDSNKYFLQIGIQIFSGNRPRARGQWRRHGDGGRAPGESRPQQGVSARLHRFE